MPGLRDSAVNGMMWKAADKFGTKLIQFVVGIIIARVLLPEDFGIIGILMLFISLSEIILDCGFANALIQKQDRTDDDYATAFYFNCAVGFVMYGIVYVCAPFIADFYEMPELCDVARAYSMCFVFNSMTIVHVAKLSIELNFKLQAMVSLLSILFSSVVGIGMAYQGCGVWALVMQGLTARFFTMLLLWLTTRWVPKQVFSVESFKQLWGFGSKILCSGLINATYNNLYSIVIGKVFTPAEVGHFNRGVQFSDLPSTTLTNVVTTVNYPILARLQDDDEALRRVYLKCLRAPLYLLYPLLTVMIVAAKPLVLVLIGEQWLPCVPLLQISCIGAMWNPLTTVNLNLLYVKGRTNKVLKLEFIKKPIAFAILFGMMPFGLIWLCIGRSLYDFIAFCFNCYYTNKYLSLGFWQQMKSIMPLMMYCAIAAIAMMGVDYFIGVENIYMELLLLSVVGTVVYLATSAVFRDESLLDICTMVKEKLSSRQ